MAATASMINPPNRHKNGSKDVIATAFLAQGLLIVLVVVVYLHHVLSHTVAIAVKPEVKACARNVSSQCQLYPCAENSALGKTEVGSRDSLFGYAGRFVHRVGNTVTKPLPQTLGDTGWASGCILSDDYKFVFIHVLKSGGTAVKKFIRDSLCGRHDEECAQAPKTLIRAEGCIKSIRDHPSYFHFSFVRNPFSRLYSAYSMMDGFPPANGIRGRRPTTGLSFADFALKPEVRALHTSMWPGHYENQTEMLFSEADCPVFDFLGRLEHFDKDMRSILQHLNATKMLDHLDAIGGRIAPANSWGSDRKNSRRGGLRAEYAAPGLVARVAADYRRDFAMLGYDPDEVPRV